ncbi:MAG: hypothetical protein AB7S39_08115 [Gemmatimonadales bacterium]
MNSASPDGRYTITTSAWEVRMSLWIETPSLADSATGQVLWTPEDGNWSLDAALWTGPATLRLTLRKYPGNHTPADVTAEIDCRALTARVGDGPAEPLDTLDRRLERALRWG